MMYVIDTVRVFIPKCPLTTIGSRFSADELQIVRGEAKRILWKKKNEYRYLTYTTIIDNSFDRKKRINKFESTFVKFLVYALVTLN